MSEEELSTVVDEFCRHIDATGEAICADLRRVAEHLARMEEKLSRKIDEAVQGRRVRVLEKRSTRS